MTGNDLDALGVELVAADDAKVPQTRQRPPRWHAFGSGSAGICGPSCEVERIRR